MRLQVSRTLTLPYTGRLFVYFLLFMDWFNFTPLRRFMQLLGWLQKMGSSASYLLNCAMGSLALLLLSGAMGYKADALRALAAQLPARELGVVPVAL